MYVKNVCVARSAVSIRLRSITTTFKEKLHQMLRVRSLRNGMLQEDAAFERDVPMEVVAIEDNCFRLTLLG